MQVKIDMKINVRITLYLFECFIIFKQIRELLIIPVFFILLGVLFNSVAHILLSVYVGGYFPGLITALIYAVLGPIIVKIVIDDLGKTSGQTE